MASVAGSKIRLKKGFPYENTCGIMSFEYEPECNWQKRKGDKIYEARKDIKYKEITKHP